MNNRLNEYKECPFYAAEEAVMATINDENFGNNKFEKYDRYDISKLMSFKNIIDKDCSKTDFVKPGFPLGTIGSLIAPKGTGKTYRALQDGLLIAATQQYGKRGGVLYLAADNSTDEIVSKFQNIVKAFNLTDKETNYAQVNFKIWSLFEESPDLLEDIKNNKRPLVDAVCAIEKIYDHRNPLRLIIFDTLRQFTRADERDNKSMRQLLAVLKLICKRLNCSCLILRHSPQNIRFRDNVYLCDLQQLNYHYGSSVLFDDIQYHEYMATMNHVSNYCEVINGIMPEKSISTENRNLFVHSGCYKQNYGDVKPIAEQWYKRNENGVLLKTNIEYIKCEENFFVDES